MGKVPPCTPAHATADQHMFQERQRWSRSCQRGRGRSVVDILAMPCGRAACARCPRSATLPQRAQQAALRGTLCDSCPESVESAAARQANRACLTAVTERRSNQVVQSCRARAHADGGSPRVRHGEAGKSSPPRHKRVCEPGVPRPPPSDAASTSSAAHVTARAVPRRRRPRACSRDPQTTR